MARSSEVQRDRDRPGAYIHTLRALLRLVNAILLLIGLAMLGYAVYMYMKFKGTEFPSFGPPAPAPAPAPGPPPPPPSSHKLSFPWFIFAFGGAGLFTFLTAATGLAGVGWNSRWLLGIYSVFIVIMLLVQAAVAITLFADDSWRKYLPPDQTGEFHKIERFVKHKLDVCRWVGLAVLIMQLLSLGLAYALSAAQQKLLDVSDDDDDEVWGRRRPLLSNSMEAVSPMERGQARTDAWSQRMRDKYGLDTSNFSYDPDARDGQSGPNSHPIRQESLPQQRRCSIM